MKTSKVRIIIALITLVIIVGTMAFLNSRSNNEVTETKIRMEMVDPEAVMFDKEDLVEIKDIDDPFPHSVKGTIETITTQGKEGEEISFIKLVDSEIYYKFLTDYETIKSLNVGDTIRIHYADTSKLFKNSDLR